MARGESLHYQTCFAVQFHLNRYTYVESKGLLYVGTGVSGGEESACFGPSIMLEGSLEAWPYKREIFQAVSAKVEEDVGCDWEGKNGAEHYVKITHNGIEYGDVQLICEAYDLLKMSNVKMHQVFAGWNETKLDSYLIKIICDILGYRNNHSLYVIDTILDTADQKGTGKWTVISALDMGISLTLITEAVLPRFLLAHKDAQIKAFKVLTGASASYKRK